MPESANMWTAADVDQLLQESRAEALVELKASLKAALLPAILEHALQGMPSAEPRAPARPTLAPLAAHLPAVAAPPRPSQPAPVFGYYVYGVTANIPRAHLPTHGIDPRYTLFTLPHRSIQALVSKVPLDTFGEAVLQHRLNDTAWLNQTLQTHHRILRHLQAQGVLLPMRFCTICHDAAGVRRFLNAHYDDFVQTLGMLEDKQEWRVVITCDERLLRQAMIAMSDRAQALQARLKDQSAPTAQFLRKKLDEVLTDEADTFRQSCAEQTHRMLAEVAEEAVLQSRPGATDAVLGSAYLVGKHRWEVFRNRLELMQATYGDLGFTFDLTGPWPPYHFASVQDAADDLAVPLPATAEPIWFDHR